jgi:hypothetical protein
LVRRNAPSGTRRRQSNCGGQSPELRSGPLASTISRAQRGYVHHRRWTKEASPSPFDAKGYASSVLLHRHGAQRHRGGTEKIWSVLARCNMTVWRDAVHPHFLCNEHFVPSLEVVSLPLWQMRTKASSLALSRARVPKLLVLALLTL